MFDQNGLADYLLKMVNEHPLLTYIEDAFAQGDISGYQKLASRFKDRAVTVAVKNWFGSNLEEMKKHTKIVPIEVEDDEAQNEEAKAAHELDAKDSAKDLPKEDEGAKAAKLDPKASQKTVATSKDSKEKLPPANASKAPVAAVQEEVKVTGPNAQKIKPDAVHFDRTKHNTTQAMLDMVQYVSLLKEDEYIGLVIDDCAFESKQTDLIDFAFATQCLAVNIKGICRPERAAKVERF